MPSAEQLQLLTGRALSPVRLSMPSAANGAFSPSEEEVSHAVRVIDAYAEAARSGSALVVLEGKLVEELHVRAAERVVAMHEEIRKSEA